jgi:hypothetical protein
VVSGDDAYALLVWPSPIRLDRAPSPSDELHLHSSTPYTHRPHHLLCAQHNTKPHVSIARYMQHHDPTIHSTRLPKSLPTPNSTTRSFVPSPLSSCLYSIWPLAENPRCLCLRDSAQHGRRASVHQGGGSQACSGTWTRHSSGGRRRLLQHTSHGCSQKAWAGGIPYSESLQGGYQVSSI